MTYQERIDALRALKEAQTQAKLQKNGSMDEDDYGSVLPPEGVEIPIEFNDPVNKTFYGARLWGKNFRALMEASPRLCGRAGRAGGPVDVYPSAPASL